MQGMQAVGTGSDGCGVAMVIQGRHAHHDKTDGSLPTCRVSLAAARKEPWTAGSGGRRLARAMAPIALSGMLRPSRQEALPGGSSSRPASLLTDDQAAPGRRAL